MNDFLANLINPALVLTATGITINFFGWVISDQIPYADDKKWQIKANGIIFVIFKIVIPGCIAAGLVEYFRIQPHHFLSLSFNILVSTILLFLTRSHSDKIYRLLEELPPQPELKFFWATAETLSEDWKKYKQLIWQVWKNWYVSPSLTVILLATVVSEMKDDYRWAIANATFVFLSFFCIAFEQSLRQIRKLASANIHLKAGEILTSAKIIKVSDPFIRANVDGKTMLINKDQISKIEIL